MNWIGISGSWRQTSQEVEADVRREVAAIIKKGDGIVSGGALNVDYFATDEAIKHSPDCSRIKIFLPSTLDLYTSHYRKRAKEGVITSKQAEGLIRQLSLIKSRNPKAIIENLDNKIIDKENYFKRNSEVVNISDELLAFHVNGSEGVGDTVKKAQEKGIKVRVFEYYIKSPNN